jgi:hypothetical protein
MNDSANIVFIPVLIFLNVAVQDFNSATNTNGFRFIYTISAGRNVA